MWFLKWWPYALGSHLNPFVTDLIWSPVGFNVTWTTSIPLGVLLAPLTKMIGLPATYNLLMLSAPALAGIAAYALCRRVSSSFWPAVFGGYIFGFSPYVLCQMQAHAHLILMFPIPLSAWLIVRWYQNSLSSRSFAALYAMTMIAEFLLSVEMFALTAIVTALALGLAFTVGDETLRQKAIRLLPAAAAAWAITFAVVSPYVYYMLSYAQPAWPIWPAYKFSIDLLNFVVPTEVNLVGANRWFSAISSRFTGNPIERDGYLAFPLIAIVVGWSFRNWRNRRCRPFILLLAAITMATLGPLLQVGGRFVAPMPWLIIQYFPMLKNALPARMMVFVFLIVAVITAIWFSDSETSPRVKAIAGAMIVLLTLPNLSKGFWTTRIDTPQFFTDGTYARYLSPRDVVLALPWGDQGMSMLWQAECGMCFRNVAGWTGLSRFEVRRWPIVNYFIGDEDVPEPELQLKAFLARMGVNAILIEDDSANSTDLNALASRLGLSRIKVGGVSLYRVPAGAFADYREASGIEMEKRADDLRFAMLLEAAGRYLAVGYDPRKISRSELIGLSLLPADWTRNPLHPDAFVAPSDGGIAISEMGSRAGLDDLIRRYRGSAKVVLYPNPRILSSKEHMSVLSYILHETFPPFTDASDGDAQHFLCVVFDPPQLSGLVGDSRGR
jgi:hypothetical protein